MRIDLKTPTLADKLAQAGFATAGFVAAYPLDRRFGLIKGFQTYGDRMPPSSNGRAVNERPGREVVDEALVWFASHRDRRFFLWVHLFEPHAPYGDPANPRGLSAAQRYDEEITEADRQAGRIVEALAPIRNETMIVAAADHGESFGEHGEVGHSIFLYDTTLRVPLIMTGPGVPPGRTVGDVAALIDVAPTVIALLGVPPLDADGIDLRPAFQGTSLPARELYAETFAPLLDFGWSPLHALRSGAWKYIDAPRPELFDIARDPMEEHDLSRTEAKRLTEFHEAVARRSGPSTPDSTTIDPEARARLEALGYVGGSVRPASANRVDPKDKKEEAARLADRVGGAPRSSARTCAPHSSRFRRHESTGQPAARLRAARFGPMPRSRRQIPLGDRRTSPVRRCASRTCRVSGVCASVRRRHLHAARCGTGRTRKPCGHRESRPRAFR
jgi:arylsulfatase A-like enzyme